MKILIYHWNSYNQKAIENAIKHLGHSTTLLTEKISNIEKDTEYTQKLADKLKHQKYDMLFSINYFPVLAQACHETLTPYICWNCDSPLLAMYDNSIFYETNFIFTFDYSNYEEFKNLGVRHIYHLPLASGTNASVSVPAQSLKYDISFIGSLYEKIPLTIFHINYLTTCVGTLMLHSTHSYRYQAVISLKNFSLLIYVC